MKSIIPVLLAGGSGTRLWPLSRKSFPKQFSNIAGSNTLFQNSALRLISSAKVLFKKHITVTILILGLSCLSNYLKLVALALY